ncbi:12596_t:CDS:2, partial [Racocetra fulgida]
TNVDPTPSLSAVPFSKFTKINDIINITEEITPIYQSAEHNKRISKSLSERIVAIETSLRLLKAYKDEHREFFNKQNFVSIQKLSDIIQKMKTFISEITQLKGLRKYCQTKSIQTIFYELTTEFDRCINTLNFINTDNIKSRTEHEKEIIDNDLEELNQYLFKIGGGITDENYNISETINEINLVKKFIWDSRSNRENREQIMEIIEDQNKLLELADFIETDEIRGKKVRKYIRLVDNKALAEQRIPYEDLDDIMAIKDRVYKEKYREPFTNYSGLPKEYKDISRKEFRPTLTEMFKTLQNLLEPSNTPNFSSKIPYKINDISPISHIYNNENNFQDDKIHVAETINFAEFNYMTMKEAISTHRATNGNLEMAFKCFNAYAKLGTQFN